MNAENIRSWLRERTTRYFETPVARSLSAIGVTPTVVTVVGLLIGLAGAVLVGLGWLWIGALVFGFGALMDSIDGTLARMQGKQSRQGAMLDSVLDRVQESAMLIGLAVHFGFNAPDAPQVLNMVLAMVALFASYTFSYARAVGSNLGATAKAGFFSRAERAIVIVILLVAGRPEWLVWVLVIGILPNAIWRIAATLRELTDNPRSSR